MYRLIPAGCVLALSLLTPFVPAQDKAAETRRPEDQPRCPAHKDFLQRIEQSKGVGDVISWAIPSRMAGKAKKPGRSTSAPSNR